MANDLDLLTANIQNYVVSPLNAFGLGGFMFDIEGEATTSLHAEITDHYMEDNHAVQDHIARKPRQITLKGYIGELTYKPKGDGLNDVVQSVVQKLTVVTSYLPKISTAVSQVQTALSSGSGLSGLKNFSLSDGADIFGMVKNAIGSTVGDMPKQQQGFAYFKALWESGTLMGVQTPWEFITNMAIESVTAIQSEGSKTISDFTIRLKQIRVAKTKTTNKTTGLLGGISTSIDNLSKDITGAVNDIAKKAQEFALDTVLQGAASIQDALPISIGNIGGMSLPSDALSGIQSNLSSASDILSNPEAMKIFTRAAGAP